MKYLVIAIIFLLTFLKSSAQPAVTTLSRKFQAYQSALPKTKLHLVFNQNKYAPGDTAWFKAYFLTASLTGVESRQLIEFNLVDSKGDSKLHFMFGVNNGVGHNQLAIPETLPAGIYLATAHSSWMKNFEPPQVFKKEIIIVGKNTVVEDQKKPRASAEGGHLIRDIPNKISILTYKPGSPVQIIDSVGQEMLRTTADRNGVASGVFTPRQKTSYFIRIVGGSEKTPLPPTEDNGCGILLMAAPKDEPLKIIVAAPSGSPLQKEELIVMVTSRGAIIHTATFLQLEKASVELLLPQKNLGEGIAEVSILDQRGTLLASRNFYHPGNGQVEAKIQPAKDRFQTREKVRLEIFLTDDKGQPLEGEFAMSILNTAMFDDVKLNSLSDELNILSIINEDFFVDRTDPNWHMMLDNYLISTHGDVPWQKIMSKEAPRPRFGFTNVVQKNGRVYFAETGQPVPDLTPVMFYLQKSKWSYQTFTLEKGKVRVTVPDMSSQDEFFYLAETRKGKEIPDLKIEWEGETPLQLPRATPSHETESPDRYASFAVKKKLIDKSYGFYRSGDVEDNYINSPGESQPAAKVLEADVVVNIQDYILFPTMEDLIREVIPSVFHRRTGGKDIVRVNIPEPMRMSTADPVYIIDGIATRNTAFFLSLKPTELLTVKIVKDPKKLLPRGLLGKNGIVIVQTIKGDVREPLDDASKLIDGLNRPLNFRAHDHSVASDQRRPDFRSTVHWNPIVKTDASGKAIVEFFCSDDVGKLNIRIDGMATGGRPFSAQQEVEVVNGTEKK